MGSAGSGEAHREPSRDARYGRRRRELGSRTDLLLHAGQPFADTSLFAVNAVCRLMRRHVTVALSGDGGDEGLVVTISYWEIARIARLQTVAYRCLACSSYHSASPDSLGHCPYTRAIAASGSRWC